MCIVFYTVAQPGYKLILAANRDEFLDRPASAAHWHNFDTVVNEKAANGNGNGNRNGFPNGSAGDGDGDGDSEDNWVLCGRDEGSPDKGTWMGMTRDLRVATLTNIRYPITPPPPDAHSRGRLLKSYLSPAPSSPHRPTVDAYMATLVPDAYTGFNLLLFDLAPATPVVGYVTNRATPQTAHPDAPGEPKGTVRGISNSAWDAPYPKLVEGEAAMKAALEEWEGRGEGEAELVERMMGVLSPAPEVHNVDDLVTATRVRPIVIPTADVSETGGTERWYGTRISTVILVKDDGQVTFVERDIAVLDEESGKPVDGDRAKERRFTFQAQTV